MKWSVVLDCGVYCVVRDSDTYDIDMGYEIVEQGMWKEDAKLLAENLNEV